VPKAYNIVLLSHTSEYFILISTCEYVICICSDKLNEIKLCTDIITHAWRNRHLFQLLHTKTRLHPIQYLSRTSLHVRLWQFSHTDWHIQQYEKTNKQCVFTYSNHNLGYSSSSSSSPFNIRCPCLHGLDGFCIWDTFTEFNPNPILDANPIKPSPSSYTHPKYSHSISYSIHFKTATCWNPINTIVKAKHYKYADRPTSFF